MSIGTKTLGGAVGVALGAAVAAGAIDHHQFITTSERQACSFTVNGFPVRVFAGTNSLSVASEADPFLVQGTNVIVIRSIDATNDVANFRSALLRFRLDYGGPDSTGRVATCDLVRQTFAPVGVILERTEWNAGAAFTYTISASLDGVRTVHAVNVDTRQTGHQHLTGVGTNLVEIRTALTRPRLTSLPWTGPGAEPDAADRTAIEALAMSIQQALAAKNTDQMIAVLAARAARYAAARGRPPEEEAADLRSIYGGLFGDAACAAVPLDPADLVLRPCPGANLVEVTRNGEYPFQLTGGAGENAWRFRIPFYVSEIAGQWVWVE